MGNITGKKSHRASTYPNRIGGPVPLDPQVHQEALRDRPGLQVLVEVQRDRRDRRVPPEVLQEPTGATGAGFSQFAVFYALMPPDNSATVAVGAAVQFPRTGPSRGSIIPLTVSTFQLPLAGTYEVTWQVSVNEPGQLQLALGGVGLPDTVTGRATGTSQISGSTLITVTGASILSLINPPGNSTALTITPIAGGTDAVSATLSVKFLG